ncbi:hypothetical protein FF100_22125 [Methylobacterium terricola]|uniref:Uncharacterized protein n=1 Tax=Methylobacterium terricola TaxID=2583531 RepID=A0A5C4LDN4_9HYPH|nr:hypothetical protein [Methylobacterium terricola]TNC10851.1 hypothetical protein FF100_22125 [Methylobacterium terricola]
MKHYILGKLFSGWALVVPNSGTGERYYVNTPEEVLNWCADRHIDVQQTGSRWQIIVSDEEAVFDFRMKWESGSKKYQFTEFGDESLIFDCTGGSRVRIRSKAVKSSDLKTWLAEREIKVERNEGGRSIIMFDEPAAAFEFKLRWL